MTKTQQKLVEKMQEEMHQYAKEVMNKSKDVDYQDVVAIFLLMKIAELQEKNFWLEERIDTLESDLKDLEIENSLD